MIDRIDAKILNRLSHDGRISMTALSAEVGLSKTPTQARVRRLEKMGAIRGYRAVLDPIVLGQDHVSFIEIKLTDTRESALTAFNKAVSQIAEVEECHLIAGAFDYLLKVRSSGMVSYRQLLAEKISTLPHIAHTSTNVAMQAIRESGMR